MRDFLAKFVPRGSVVLAATTFGSYALGLLRDRLFAQSFGASTSLDSYNAAFLLPDFVFNVLVASGIAAAVVPLFTELRRRNQSDANTYLNAVISAAVGTMAISGLVILLAAPLLSRLVAPGLTSDAHALVARLMRILALSPLLFGASNALGAMLVAQKRFFFYGLSPILYNLGIIGGTLLLAPRFGIAGAAYGTVAGAGLHLAARLIDGLNNGWRWRRLRPLPIAALKRTLRLMVPKMFGHPVELATFWVFTSLASLLSAGSITVLNFSRNFQSVPVSVIGIAMATAVFPALAEGALESKTALRRLLYRTAATILFTSSAAALLLFAIRRPLVALLLGGGAFDAAAIERTALTLGVFCLAIPTESVSHLLARAFYATQNTTVPVLFSILGLATASTVAYLLLGPLGIISLPLGFFFGSAVKTIGLYVVLQTRLR